MKKAKGTVFIEHIKEHLLKGDEGTHSDDQVVCKICDMTVDEIYEEWKREVTEKDTNLSKMRKKTETKIH